ncbi:YdbL family protein [Teredinibacter haidensis]|uniref:YdbL family protein n=1 Tax=Teredinibacter haidensis TaxID=2731755 RepID=UPI000948CC29|nr:YdbL family protein [Teredinibacter haidensis]
MKTTKALILALLTTFCFALPAYALDLQQAKTDGLVGEMNNGYLGSPQETPSTEVQALIKDINSKRKDMYNALANSQNLSLEAIEKLAGEKAFAKTASGHYIKTPGSGWQKK